MFAIVGAKGGCGTSTLTLALAQELSQRNRKVVAIDADRQLPNLHILADADRRPTVAQLSADEPVAKTLQQFPQRESVTIVPAPTASQDVEYSSLKAIFKSENHEVIFDCPSGTGPDVVDPMKAADGVIVVTDHTTRSIEAAKTSIEMTRRLEVPVRGVIVNKSTEIPAEVKSWDVPILGTVPERSEPLSDADVGAATSEICDTLERQTPSDWTLFESEEGRLATGILEFDTRVDGGVPAGSTIALIAEPTSQGEHLLHLISRTRGTLYVSPDRSTDLTRVAIERASTTDRMPTVRSVDPETKLEDAVALIERTPDNANVILDSINEFERADRDEYRHFLEQVQQETIESAGLTVFHCLPEDTSNRRQTLRFADIVLKLEQTYPTLGTGAEYYLSVLKYRPNAGVSDSFEIVPSEPVALTDRTPLDEFTQ